MSLHVALLIFWLACALLRFLRQRFWPLYKCVLLLLQPLAVIAADSHSDATARLGNRRDCQPPGRLLLRSLVRQPAFDCEGIVRTAHTRLPLLREKGLSSVQRLLR